MRYKHEIEEELADLQFHLEELEIANKRNKRSAVRLPKQIDKVIDQIEEKKKELKEVEMIKKQEAELDTV